MNFADLRFWGFLFAGLSVLVVVRMVLWTLRPAALGLFDRVALLALGMFLLLCVGYLTFIIWLAVAVGTYAGVWWLITRKPKSQKLFLAVLIPLQLAPLFYYKYADFTMNGVLGLNFNSLRDLIIPAGLSFYTFQKVAFVIDILHTKEPLPGFLDYLNFAGFFPQIVAGPIERKRDLLPQMERFRFVWSAENLNDGISWVVVGLFFKCCLADNMALWMRYFSESTSNAYQIWAANLVFGLRCYFDFAGYSLVALGIARCLGVRLTLNFMSPYCSTSMQEYWNRWHVSLSRWFRDYVYIPLGWGLNNHWAENILIVFVVSGIWHGAGWNFVLWGAIHGVFLIINQLPRRFTLPAPVAWFGTMSVVLLAWLCFYETRFNLLELKLGALFSPHAYSMHALREAKTRLTTGEWVGFGSMLAIVCAALTLEWISVRRRNEPFWHLRQPVVLGILVVMTVLLAPDSNNSFIYFAF